MFVARYLDSRKTPFVLGSTLVLGGSWDVLTTYNWACNPTSNPPK